MPRIMSLERYITTLQHIQNGILGEQNTYPDTSISLETEKGVAEYQSAVIRTSGGVYQVLC